MKRQDEETGFGYHGARYYAVWLGRWLCTDPIGIDDGPNLYRYARDNPLHFTDKNGQQCDSTVASCSPELMSRWQYSEPVPNRSTVGHNVQKDHAIQISVRARQRGRTNKQQRTVSSQRDELTILVETGKGRFHTELGILQAEIRRRVDAGLITSESQLIDETRKAYKLAGRITRTKIKHRELDAVLVSNLGVQSETYEQTRQELARFKGPTTVTEESINKAFTEWYPDGNSHSASSAKAHNKMSGELPDVVSGGYTEKFPAHQQKPEILVTPSVPQEPVTEQFPAEEVSPEQFVTPSVPHEAEIEQLIPPRIPAAEGPVYVVPLPTPGVLPTGPVLEPAYGGGGVPIEAAAPVMFMLLFRDLWFMLHGKEPPGVEYHGPTA